MSSGTRLARWRADRRPGGSTSGAGVDLRRQVGPSRAVGHIPRKRRRPRWAGLRDGVGQAEMTEDAVNAAASSISATRRRRPPQRLGCTCTTGSTTSRRIWRRTTSSSTRARTTSVWTPREAQWVANYYDSLVNFKLNVPPAGGMLAAFLVAPQNREFAAFLYEAAANATGVRGANAQVRSNPGLLVMARELGDTQVAERLQAAADREADPRSATSEGR